MQAELKFKHLDKKLTDSEILKVAQVLGFDFPEPLYCHFLAHNGGFPVACVFQDPFLDTIVSETLPLISNSGRGTAVTAYQILVGEKKIVPPHLLPFAVDAGGDYFFCDLLTIDAQLYFFRSEYYPDNEKCLCELGMPLDDFFNNLVIDDAL